MLSGDSNNGTYGCSISVTSDKVSGTYTALTRAGDNNENYSDWIEISLTIVNNGWITHIKVAFRNVPY